jgi:hypothetical protein
MMALTLIYIEIKSDDPKMIINIINEMSKLVKKKHNKVLTQYNGLKNEQNHILFSFISTPNKKSSDIWYCFNQNATEVYLNK